MRDKEQGAVLDSEFLSIHLFGKANPFLEPALEEENLLQKRGRAASGYCLEIGLGTWPRVEFGSLTSSKHPAPAGLGHGKSSLIPHM